MEHAREEGLKWILAGFETGLMKIEDALAKAYELGFIHAKRNSLETKV